MLVAFEADRILISAARRGRRALSVLLVRLVGLLLLRSSRCGALAIA